MPLFAYLAGFSTGILVLYLLNRWAYSRKKYGGTIVVTTDGIKKIYSLELNDYPDAIDFMDEVLFKIERPDESPNRD